jgi:alanine racemase
VCDKHDFSLLTISPVNSSLDQALGRAPVDGFIIVGVNEDHTEVAPLRKRNVPFVIVDGDATMASSVNVEDASGTYDAAAHLLSRGHRNILILSLPQPEGHAEDARFGVRARRLSGYMRAFKEYGAPCDDNCIRSTESSIRGGEQAFDAAWNAGVRPTAILAMSDVIAIGAMRAAQRRGLNIPRDVEVIGFDDIVLSTLVQPTLTSVHQPIIEKGMQAIQLLIFAMDDNAGPQHIMLKTSLIGRGSTKQ